VYEVIEPLVGMGDSLLMPLGLILNAQAKNMAKGKPISARKKITVFIHSGILKAGTAMVVTWITIQARTR
jgi:hypothetical protein